MAGSCPYPRPAGELFGNISGHLCGAHERVRKATYEMFRRVNADLGARIQSATEANVTGAPPARL